MPTTLVNHFPANRIAFSKLTVYLVRLTRAFIEPAIAVVADKYFFDVLSCVFDVGAMFVDIIELQT